MPRHPRIRLDEMPLHVVQRGHNRSPCFFRDSDYLIYLHCLDQALIDTKCRLHAYVLMTNHVHLLLTPLHADTVPRLFVYLGRRYVQYVNRRYERTGTLWDSRYKGSIVQTDDYLLTCHRYIELNPVRAGIVADPIHYRWSSYHANALGRLEARLTPHPVYLGLGATSGARQAMYAQLVRSQLPCESIDEIRRALNRNHPLGNQRFQADIERATGRSLQVRRAGRPRSIARPAKADEPATLHSASENDPIRPQPTFHEKFEPGPDLRE